MLGAEDARHVAIEYTPTYYISCTLKLNFEMSLGIKMRCHDSCLSSFLSHIRTIVLDSVIKIS